MRVTGLIKTASTRHKCGHTPWSQLVFLLQSLPQITFPVALVPGFEGIAVIFYFPIAFVVLAVVVPLVLHLNHRVEVWKRRKKGARIVNSV